MKNSRKENPERSIKKKISSYEYQPLKKGRFLENPKNTKNAPKTICIQNLNDFENKRLVELLYCKKKILINILSPGIF